MRLAGIITFPAAAFIGPKTKEDSESWELQCTACYGCGLWAVTDIQGRRRGGVCLDIYDIQDVKYN